MRCVLASLCVLLLATITSAGCPGGLFSVPGASMCFKSFPGLLSWTAAKIKCLSEGLLLAKPSDRIVSNLRKYLLDEARKKSWWTDTNSRSHWVDGRGSGDNMVWQRNGTILSRTSPLYKPGQETHVSTTDCLRIDVTEAGWKNYTFRPYNTAKCASNTGGHVLCEGCPGGLFSVPGASTCFKSIVGPFSWTDAQSKCLSEGLLLAKPSDRIAVKLRKYILDEARKKSWWTDTNARSHWVDGRGSGDNMVWQRNGTTLSSSSPLYRPGQETHVATTDCLRIEVSEAGWKDSPFQAYGTHKCAGNTGGHALCEG